MHHRRAPLSVLVASALAAAWILALPATVVAGPLDAAADLSLGLTSLRLGMPDDASPRLAREVAMRALRSPQWRAADPTLEPSVDLDVAAFKFGQRFVARASPVVDGAPVEGADRLLSFAGGRVRTTKVGAPLVRKNRCILEESEATARGFLAVRERLIADPTVVKLGGLARRVWMARNDGIVAAWRVRVPTLHIKDARDVWIDAATGAVLLVEPTAKLGDDAATGGEGEGEGEIGGEGVGEGEIGGEGEGEGEAQAAAPTAARVFEFAPAAAGVNVTDLKDVELKDLVPADVGGHLRGFHFETANCCKRYVCNDGSATCLDALPISTPANTVARCATAADDVAATVESVLPLKFPKADLPIPLPGDFGDDIFIETVFCAELPRVVSRAATDNQPAGWFETPVDENRGTSGAPSAAALASEEDAFAEVEVYHGTQQYFEHVRRVLEDPAFCLGGKSMACDELGNATLVNGKPSRAFHITTNFLLPSLDPTALLFQLATRGRTAEEPLLIEDYSRLDNAAFIPAIEGDTVEVPPELEPLTRVFARGFDSNVYFQGSRDFAYDGDITRHEFTHALVHSFRPNLKSLGIDDQGSHAEPGGLNEGWSDYFSSSFSGDPVIGEYAGQGIGEAGVRDISRAKTCPEDITGEVHDDSEPWAGALWSIREAVVASGGEPAVLRLDKALLQALSVADDDETFAKAAARVVVAVRAELGDETADTAASIFDDRRLVACDRVWPLGALADDGSVVVKPKALLNQPGAADVGLSNFAPAVLQLRVQVPAGTPGFTVRWEVAAGGAIGGLLGGAAEPPVVAGLVVETDDRVHWTYESGLSSALLAVPHDEKGSVIPFDATAQESLAVVSSANAQGVAQASLAVALASDACKARTFIVNLVSPKDAVRMQNVDLVVADKAGAACPTAAEGEGEPKGDGPSCGCTSASSSSSGLALAFAGALAALRLRRRRTAR